MNKFIRNKCIAGIIFSLIGIILIQSNTSKIEENIPSIIEVRMVTNDKNVEGVKFSEFSAVNDILYKSKVTAYSEVLSNIATEYKKYENQVKVILTDENHCSIYKNEFVSGGNFDNYCTAQGEKSAIISDKLSLELFKSYDIINNKINLLGETYKVVGVYKTDDSFISEISGDGVERVIIPYTSYNESQNLLLDTMSVQSSEVSKADFKYNIKKVAGEKINNYKSIDYQKEKATVTEIKSLVFFIIGIILLVLISKLIYKILMREYQRVVAYKDKYYFIDIIKKEKKSLIITAVISLLLIICIIFIFNYICFDLVAPEGYIPEDNIFDITFYKDTYIKNIQLINSGIGIKLSLFDRYLSNAMLFQLVNGIIILLSVLPIMISRHEFKLLKKQSNN